MSLINLIVREKGKLYGTCVHWKQLLTLLNLKLHGIRDFMFDKEIKIKPYDAGILVIDFDKRLIFSFHVCFRLTDVDKEAVDWFYKHFTFVDYTSDGLSLMWKDLGIAGFEVEEEWWK